MKRPGDRAQACDRKHTRAAGTRGVVYVSHAMAALKAYLFAALLLCEIAEMGTVYAHVRVAS